MSARISVYVGPPLQAALDAVAGDDAPSSRINTVCERYLALVADELRRVSLTRAEWAAIMDANNGVTLYPVPAAMMWANVHDSPRLGEKWGIDQAALVRRLQALPPGALIAIQEACDRFWSRADLPTDAALHAAGITVVEPPRPPAVDLRDLRVREEILSSLIDETWGAVKAWQQADERRPQMEYAAVAAAAEDYLRGLPHHQDGEKLITEGVAALLKILGCEDAAIHWANRP